ncbi:hypothetical protein ACFL2D_02690 [Patescibacteria group bacterium]
MAQIASVINRKDEKTATVEIFIILLYNPIQEIESTRIASIHTHFNLA